MSKRKVATISSTGKNDEKEKWSRDILTIDLTHDNDSDEFESLIPTIKKEKSEETEAEFSSDPESVDGEDEISPYSNEHDLPHLAYYRGDTKLPIYSYTSPDLKKIFQICLKKDTPADRMTGTKPTSISTTSTFVVDQKLANIKHPFDVEADETLGAYEKKEQTRFYEVTVNNEGELLISSEVSVNKNDKGIVVGGTCNVRDGRNWVRRTVEKEHLYAVIRKRAVHKKTMEIHQTAFTRYVIFIMPIAEYDEVYSRLKSLMSYTLKCPTIIMHYYFNTGNAVPIVATTHGNATRPYARSFVSREHSLKQEVKETLRTDGRAPRIIQDEKSKDIDLINPPLQSTTIRNSKQIYNYRHLYGETKTKTTIDQIQEVILKLLEQGSSADDIDPDVLDKNQAFVREFLLRHEKQACFVAYLQQSLTDIERFSTTSANPRFTTPLACDTTFNIANYLVTQTTYKQMSVIDRESLKNPWFPGPFLVHRNQSTQDFSYFWQAVKRGNPALSNILVLGTDEDEALSGGILKETSGTTIHLLGKEHVQANVDKKLQSLNFPSIQRKIILSDIFGGATCKEEDSLYGSESAQIYNRKLLQLKSKWLQIEKEHTSNRPASKFVDYFEAHKEKQIRDKMIKEVRKQASIDGVYGQNPIEWQNFLSKDEISASVRSEGRSHRDATLSECLDALKTRSLRLYSNVVKALYDDGPYVISPAYHMFRKIHADWRSMSSNERKSHISAFMAYIPTDDVLLRSGVRKSTLDNSDNEENEESIPSISLLDDETSDQVPCRSKEREDGLEVSQQVSNDLPSNHSDPFKPVIKSQTILDKPRRKLSVSFQEASVLNDVLPSHLLEDAFHKAEELINEPNSITKAASDDDRLRTVKSRYGSVPLIVKPYPKNRDLFQCTCKVYKALGMCCDAIAVADEVGVLCNYLCELRKKLGKRKKSGKGSVNITAAVQSDLSSSLKGHKQNEVQKLSRRKSKSFQESIAEDLIQNRPTTSDRSFPIGSVNRSNTQQSLPMSTPASSTHYPPFLPTAPIFQPTNQYAATGAQSFLAPQMTPLEPTTISTVQNRNRNSVTFQQASASSTTCSQIESQPFISNLQPQCRQLSSVDIQQQSNASNRFASWNSSMSPYRYELVLLPNSVTKCYGCYQEFTRGYRMPPNNLVVRHMDRRITGRDQSGQLLFSPDFRATYYHPVKEHIMLKNPAFDGRVFVTPVLSQMLSPDHVHVVNHVLNLDVKVLQDS